MENINDVPMILRRQIEASVIGPFFSKYSKELGYENNCEITKEVISGLAKEAGASLAKAVGFKTLLDIKEKVNPLFNKGGVLEINYKECSKEKLVFDVTKCAYVEMYKKLGMEDLGYQLSCQRDEFLFKGMNSNIKFTRTQTLMEGGKCCDFCLELDKESLDEN